MVEELLRKGLREEFERLRKMDRKVAIREGKREGIEQGKREGIEQGKKIAIQMAQRKLESQWIVKMIKSDVSEQKILEITEISKKELEEIKSKMQEKTS